MRVYHGSNIIVEKPDTTHSAKFLDFGSGFYTTSNEAQSILWAKRKAFISKSAKAFVSVYEISEQKGFNTKDFGDNLEEWIDFVCECRAGSDVFKSYDVIKGKVANDKVFRVVDMYRRKIWDRAKALNEIKVYETYDQICFVSQKALDEMLSFVFSYEVEL